MKIYENITIVNPNASEDEVDSVIESFKGAIEACKGEVLNVEKWGKRNLAYEVQKHTQGHFILMHLKSPREAVDELARRGRITDAVIKQQTVAITEELFRKWMQEHHKAEPEAETPAETPAAPSGGESASPPAQPSAS